MSTAATVTVVTGASSGFGAMTVRALADAGHVVYAGMRDIDGRNADAAALARAYPGALRPVEMDVSDQASVDAAVAAVLAEAGHIGVVVPGSFTTGTNHFANAGHPADEAVAAAYEQRYSGLMDDVSRRLAEIAPPDADPAEVARRIVDVVGAPRGTRPFLVYIDPADDGAEDVFRVGDRVRQWFYQRIGLADLLTVNDSR